MKISYIVHGYTNSGGTERVLATKANYLATYGYNVSIISMGQENKSPFFSYSPQIQFYHLNLSGNDLKNKHLFMERVSACLNTIKPDIAITMGFGVSKYLYEVKDGSKKIFEYHFSKYKRKFELAALDKYSLGRIFTDIYSYKRSKIARRYDRFIVLTNEDKESWRNIPNIEVISNPLSFVTDKYSDVTAKRVISVGRYTYQKGFDLLIDIWSEINKRYPDWKLSIYGSGGKKAYLENCIKKFGLSDVIELHPPTPNVDKEFLESSIFAMTSRYEGFGLVLSEAMSCGLPVISYACKCGPRDIIKDGEDGFLIEFKDKPAFIDKLSLLIEDQALRTKMGEAARNNVARFNIENIMPKWISLFEQMIPE